MKQLRVSLLLVLFLTGLAASPAFALNFPFRKRKPKSISPPPAPPPYSEEKLAEDLLWEEFLTLPKARRPAVGLALGGGGARGLVHVGVLKIFNEERVPVDKIAGTSVGALIGALYSAGMPPQQMEQLAYEVGWRDLTNYSKSSLLGLIFKQKLLSSARMEDYLRKHIGEKRFDELSIPFFCVATDLATGEKIVFSEGEVALAARASATVPGVFEPVSYRHRLLVDGGLVDNLPTELLRASPGDVTVAVLAKPDFSSKLPENILQTLNQSIYIQGETQTDPKVREADFVILPPVGPVSVLEINKHQALIDAGVTEARRRIPALKRLVMERNLDAILEGKR